MPLLKIQINTCTSELYCFAVNLDAEDKNWVEPDISVICDPDKLTDRACEGAPFIITFDQTIETGIGTDLRVNISEFI